MQLQEILHIPSETSETSTSQQNQHRNIFRAENYRNRQKKCADESNNVIVLTHHLQKEFRGKWQKEERREQEKEGRRGRKSEEEELL